MLVYTDRNTRIQWWYFIIMQVYGDRKTRIWFYSDEIVLAGLER